MGALWGDRDNCAVAVRKRYGSGVEAVRSGTTTADASAPQGGALALFDRHFPSGGHAQRAHPRSEKGRSVGLDPSLADILGTPLTVVDAGLETGRATTGVDWDGPSFGVPATDDPGVPVRVRREVELPGVDPFGGLAGLAVGAFALGVLSAGTAGLLADDAPETISQRHFVFNWCKSCLMLNRTAVGSVLLFFKLLF